MAASVAGLDFYALAERAKGSAPDILGIIDEISDGETIKEGPFEGTYFGVPSLSERDKRWASFYLELSGNELSYRSTPKRHSEFYFALAPLAVVLLAFWGYVIWEVKRRNSG